MISRTFTSIYSIMGNASEAHAVEHWFCKPAEAGSNLAGGSNSFHNLYIIYVTMEINYTQLFWTLAILVVILTPLLTLTFRNLIFHIPKIKVSQSFEQPKTPYVARLKGFYSYEARGATKDEAVGGLITLIDDLKHSSKNITRGA